ncbi:MAG: hypothetical protein GX893_07825 [Firmicutes bacterium]|nr:hypothetical protein [Bacillota bacterium]
MKIKLGNKKDKHILVIFALVLIFIGVSYALTNAQAYMKSTFITGNLLELVPEECLVLETSEGVWAEVDFLRDGIGRIIDKTSVNLLAANVIAGSFVEYRLSMQNISELSVMVDEWYLEVDEENDSLADCLFFSGTIKVEHHDGQHADLLGSFANISLAGLNGTLTNIMQYRTISRDEKIILDLKQQLGDKIDPVGSGADFSYKLIPVFVQYFPENKNSYRKVKK